MFPKIPAHQLPAIARVLHNKNSRKSYWPLVSLWPWCFHEASSTSMQYMNMLSFINRQRQNAKCLCGAHTILVNSSMQFQCLRKEAFSAGINLYNTFVWKVRFLDATFPNGFPSKIFLTSARVTVCKRLTSYTMYAAHRTTCTTATHTHKWIPNWYDTLVWILVSRALLSLRLLANHKRTNPSLTVATFELDGKKISHNATKSGFDLNCAGSRLQLRVYHGG